MHSPPLPLIVRFSPDSLHLESISLALQHHDRVNSIEIRQWSQANTEMLARLDKPFPMLEGLSLHSSSYASHVLPRNLVAPRLRSIFLLYVPISAVSPLLTNATNLISLTIALIPTYADLTPEYLVELISSLPQLEDLSTTFLPLTPEGLTQLQRTPSIRVILPSLWRFTYCGVNDYLQNLLALIGTPLLQYFCATCYWHDTCTSPHLSNFLGTTQYLHFGMAEVSIHPTKLAIAYLPAQPSASLPYFSFTIDETYDGLSQVTSLVQICSATEPILPTVEGLILRSDNERGILKFSNEQWHAFLQSFVGVRTLRTEITLAAGLSEVLRPNNGAPAEELLPRLSKLVVVSEKDVTHGPLLSSINARRLAGHHIELHIIKHHPPPFPHSDIHLAFPVF
jgi:hypothetical protein